MLDTIKHSFKELTTNRYLTVLTVINLILAVLFIVYILLNVRPSELQLVTHYTAYGITHLAGFALIIAFLHTAISLKMFLTKGHPLAIMFAWMGIGIIIFAWVTAFSIINVWSPV